MMSRKMLLIEQAPSSIALIKELADCSFQLSIVSNELAARDALYIEKFDLIISSLEPSSNFEFLKFIKNTYPDCLFIYLCPEQSVDAIVEAMHLGAFYCIKKPLQARNVSEILEKAKKQFPSLKSKKDLNREYHFIAESPAMKKILSDAITLAKSQASVFISGESGTGKEEIATVIHSHSNRSKQPFIKVNCAAIPETLIESEFFGHEKGSFTGAISSRQGRFELANKGSLLLDEISEIPPAVQAKLLRVIQEQEFERVGGVKAIKVDVRLISTSNKNMQDAIKDKSFREDLYYRLNVMPIHLPPLRERKEDILPLAEWFLDKFCRENGKEKKTLTAEAKEKLLNYRWPGNIRQLANVIERSVVMVQKEKIDTIDIFLDPTCREVCPLDIKEELSLQDIERKYILETLEKQKRNRTKTAKSLGISLRTLRNKLKEYNVTG